MNTTIEKFACEICGISSHKTATYRVNPKGEAGVFRCFDCMENEPDPEIKKLCFVVAGFACKVCGNSTYFGKNGFCKKHVGDGERET